MNEILAKWLWEKFWNPESPNNGVESKDWNHPTLIALANELLELYPQYPAHPAPTVGREVVWPKPEELARFFHNTYEEISLRHGYEARPESRVQWEDVPTKNKAVMIETAWAVLEWLYHATRPPAKQAREGNARNPDGTPYHGISGGPTAAPGQGEG